MPLVDKLIATYEVMGNGQKICTDVQTTPPGAEAQPAVHVLVHMYMYTY